VTVGRDARWNGQRYQGQEAFFLARINQPGPLSRHGLTADEHGWLQGHAWVAWSELAHLGDRVEPPQLIAVLAALDPSGPWSAGHGPASTLRSGVGERRHLDRGPSARRGR
jgi:hypothetical protein